MLSTTNLRRRSKLVLAAAAVLCFAAITTPTRAATLTAYAGINDKGVGANNITHDGTPAQVIGVYGGVDANATSSAGFGKLHLYLHAFASSTNGYAYATGGASFDDMITITGGTGTGYFNSDMILDGMLMNDGPIPAVGVTWSNYTGSTNLYALYGHTVSGTYDYQGTNLIQFTYGVPFDFAGSITGSVTWSNTSGGGYGEGLLDFGNTATIGNIQVFDSNMDPVSDFAITGSTGTNYAALVPEPTSGALLLAGAVVPMLRRKR